MKKIMIVDDSAFMRGVLKDILSECNMATEIYEADGKIGASDILKKTTPDLALLDIVMRDNEFEGIEILKEIKEFYPAVKVIMLTSVGQTAVIEECKELGAEDYIEKPFNRIIVLDAIEKFLK